MSRGAFPPPLDSSEIVVLILPEAVAQDLVGLAHDQEGVGVDALDGLLEATICFCLKATSSTFLSSPDQPPSPWRRVTPRSIS